MEAVDFQPSHRAIRLQRFIRGFQETSDQFAPCSSRGQVARSGGSMLTAVERARDSTGH